MALRPLLRVSPEDLKCLEPEGLINGEVIDACLRVLERRSLCSDNIPKMRAFDTYFFSAWDSGKYQATRGRVKQICIFTYDLLVFPIHDPCPPNGHWSLVAVWLRKKTMVAYDSLGRDYPNRKTDILAFLRAEAKEKGFQEFSVAGWNMLGVPPGTPKQSNVWDCGIFVCVFTEILARQGQIEGRRIDSSTARRKITEYIVQGQIDKEDAFLLPLAPRAKFGLDRPISRRLTEALATVVTTAPSAQMGELDERMESGFLKLPPRWEEATDDPLLNEIARTLCDLEGHEVARSSPDSLREIEEALTVVAQPAQAPREETRAEVEEDCLSLDTPILTDDEAGSEVPYTEGTANPLNLETLGRPIPTFTGLQTASGHHGKRPLSATRSNQTVTRSANRRRPSRPKRVRVWAEDGSFRRIRIEEAKALYNDFKNPYTK